MPINAWWFWIDQKNVGELNRWIKESDLLEITDLSIRDYLRFSLYAKNLRYGNIEVLEQICPPEEEVPTPKTKEDFDALLTIARIMCD